MKKILSVLIATAILICGLAIGSVGAYDEPQYALVPQITVGITPAQTKQNRLLIVNTKDTGEVQQSIGTLSQVYGNGETEMDKIDFDGEEHALIDPTSAIRNIWSPNVSKSLSRNKSFSTVRMSYTVGSQRSF